MDLEEIPRNDVKAALAYYAERKRELGKVPGDEVRVLLMLQSDPMELLEAIRKIADEPAAK